MTTPHSTRITLPLDQPTARVSATMPKQPINRQRVQRRVQYAAGRLQQRALGAIVATESLTLADVVFSNNSAALAGGGINHFNSAVAAQTPKTEAMLALVHATVSGNSVTANSGHAAGLSVAGLGLSLARQLRTNTKAP